MYNTRYTFFLLLGFPLGEGFMASLRRLEINTFALGGLNDEFSYLRLSFIIYMISRVLALWQPLVI